MNFELTISRKEVRSCQKTIHKLLYVISQNRNYHISPPKYIQTAYSSIRSPLSYLHVKELFSCHPRILEWSEREKEQGEKKNQINRLYINDNKNHHLQSQVLLTLPMLSDYSFHFLSAAIVDQSHNYYWK